MIEGTSSPVLSAVRVTARACSGCGARGCELHQPGCSNVTQRHAYYQDLYASAAPCAPQSPPAPLTLKVAHLTYNVRRMTPVELAENPGWFGFCEKSKGTIAVAPGMAPDEEAATVIHEVLHAIWHTSAMPEEVCEESLCRRLEGPLLAFLRDNPKEVAMLIAASGGVPLNIPS